MGWSERARYLVTVKKYNAAVLVVPELTEGILDDWLVKEMIVAGSIAKGFYTNLLVLITPFQHPMVRNDL
jgi:hypothetical protein